MLQHLGAADTIALGDPTQGEATALRQLFSLALREAQTMAYGDAFVVFAMCFAIATVMVPLMRKVAPPKAPSADAY
jgi:DHA2 family multidrug resistance protein